MIGQVQSMRRIIRLAAPGGGAIDAALPAAHAPEGAIDCSADPDRLVYLAFNRSKKSGYAPFFDKRVRLALSMGVDRDFIAYKLLRGGQKPAYLFVPPGTANYTSPALPYWASWPFEKRQAEARRLLKEAGFGSEGNPVTSLIAATKANGTVAPTDETPQH